VALLSLAGSFACVASAESRTPAGKVSFKSASLFPRFGPNAHDYTVRCKNRPVTVKGHAVGGWEMAIGNHPYMSGDFSAAVRVKVGQEFLISARKAGDPSVEHFYARCLPGNFPRYSFTRFRGGASSDFFSVDQFYVYRHSTGQYAAIFDQRGAPVWWYHTPAWDTRVLSNRKVLWFDRSSSPGRWGIHGLDGHVVRTLNTVGRAANPHDMQPLANGNFLGGVYAPQHHVDTRAYGGSRDADVINAELQEVNTQGRLTWDWRSQDHIALAETGRRWPWIVQHGRASGYDILHWNSIEPSGDSVIASFRHLDAVYKIRRSTGAVVWKLGGTKTPQRLKVKGDRHSYPLGAQHDARLQPDGTLTVFDNRTNQTDTQPRAVRFRIDEDAGTATLVQSITDPSIRNSHCCGSARRLEDGSWLIDWGLDNPIGSYTRTGKRIFLMSFENNFSYRAEPVPSGAVTAATLRSAMDAIYDRQAKARTASEGQGSG
jgi:hypothetical protein